MGLRDFLQQLATPAARPSRVTGPPTSSNGASSFHLQWDAPPVPLAEAAVTIEVIEAPRVDELYFWALQVSFQRGPSRVGGAHFGLQHHPAYPAAGAVNWGGYADAGGELEGSLSDLPSALNNINTRTYPWVPGRAYRYRIGPSPEGASGPPTERPIGRWRGTITDVATGAETVVRDLWVEADHLVGPMVWSEVFAHCDHPSAAVRWSDLEVLTAAGERVAIDGVRLNYQTNANGGCGNTDTSIDRSGSRPGFVQRTSCARVNDTGARLSLR